MDRRTLLTASSLSPILALAQSNPFVKQKPPVLFLAHGHPYNGLVRKRYGNLLYQLGQKLQPVPKAILVISSHWASESGTKILGAANPPTIHDFQGLGDEYRNIVYPAPGSPTMAQHTEALLDPYAVIREDWGFDQAVWILLRHLAPAAKIPVYMLSVDVYKQSNYHYLLGKMLAPLRNHGVLIVGSGNIVHNPAQVDDSGEKEKASEPWANQFAAAVSGCISSRDDMALVDFHTLPGAAKAVPTPEHFFPLLYALGAASNEGPGRRIYSSFQQGTVGMHSWMFG